MLEPLRTETSTSLREVLRDSTRLEHAALDQTLSTLNLGHSAGYASFLRIQLAALDALACAWGSTDSADFEALRRCLANDLQASTAASSHPRVARASGPAEWGIAYVIRGSRLGSTLLRARIGADFAKSYFDYVPIMTWPRFLQALEQAGATFDAGARRQAIDGAKFAFTTYAAAAPHP